MSTTSNYKSELTQFIDQLKQQDDSIEKGQQYGRKRLWDTSPIDSQALETRKRSQQTRVKQKSYVYY